MNEILGLEKADSARILIISDAHGKRAVLNEILSENEGSCDAAAYCGDGSKDFVARARIPSAAVYGNNDGGTCIIRDGFSQRAVTLNPIEFFTVCGKRIMLTHGHLFSCYGSLSSLALAAREQGADIVLYGHTHVARSDTVSGILILNPGSCAFPRSGQRPSFCILSLKAGRPPEWEFFAVA